jgi:hypothetical protein
MFDKEHFIGCIYNYPSLTEKIIPKASHFKPVYQMKFDKNLSVASCDLINHFMLYYGGNETSTILKELLNTENLKLNGAIGFILEKSTITMIKDVVEGDYIVSIKNNDEMVYNHCNQHEQIIPMSWNGYEEFKKSVDSSYNTAKKAIKTHNDYIKDIQSLYSGKTKA